MRGARVIEQEERRIDLYTRDGARWTNEVIAGNAMLNLTSIGIELALDAIYEDTDLDITRQQADAGPAPAS